VLVILLTMDSASSAGISLVFYQYIQQCPFLITCRITHRHGKSTIVQVTMSSLDSFIKFL